MIKRAKVFFKSYEFTSTLHLGKIVKNQIRTLSNIAKSEKLHQNHEKGLLQ